MNEVRFEQMVRDALQLPHAVVKNLGIIGGMTNFNYLVEVDEEEYVIRIPGNGTSSLIDRTQELQNLKLGSAIGINPELIYFNVENGLKITQRIIDARPITEAEMNKALIEKVAHIFQKLHGTTEKMITKFQLFTLMDTYEALAFNAGSDFYDGFQEVKMEVQMLQHKYKLTPVQLSPCHIDPALSNFLFDKDEQLYLIDWEYGGMFDPLWDIASFSLEATLLLEEEALFYQSYFKRAVTEEEQEKLLMHKIFQDYLWSVWTLFKEETGDNFGLYGRHRFERAKENIRRYKLLYALQSDAQ